MKISFNQPYEHVKDTNGYGYAAKMCKESLVALGHEVGWRDSTADVEINFIQPHNAIWSGCEYRILYTPWESTLFPEGWIDDFNSVDEVWTPSPVIAQWMQDAGVKKDVKVYQHGVEPIWYENSPYRIPLGTFDVLHHGAEALRKGGNDTVKAFMNTLREEDACLTLKMLLQGFNVHDTKHIKIRKNRVPIEELIELYNQSDLLCYPSYGEGFGLAPLQAMATGMPVLVTEGWAPYEYLLPTEMKIESRLIDSPWPVHHPGKVFEPDFDDLMDKLKYHYDNRSEMLLMSERIRQNVIRDYNWIDLTRDAFAHLV